MKIIDPHNLLPSREILLNVIQSHPFESGRVLQIDTVEVFLSERCQTPFECIETDIVGKRVRLGLGRSSKNKSDFHYILYHEFGHVADRSNPVFGYSEKLNELMSDPEKMAVMELWNVAIDARLNSTGFFALGAKPPCYSRKHGWLQNTVQGKLQGHAAMIENQGISYNSAVRLIEDWWSNPSHILSYLGMIEWVRRSTSEHVASSTEE